MPVRHFGLTHTTPGAHHMDSGSSEERSTTHLLLKPFGQMSTAERVNHTRHSWLGPSMLRPSVAGLVYPRRYMLARVTVCICIGRWTKRWILRRGEDMRPGSLNFLFTTGFTSTLLALRIYRRYSERPAPTTASEKPRK
jgi:hypothetical protein